MNYLISARTNIGLKKTTNQDSLSVKKLSTSKGNMVFAILCDGMGGLSKGELASATVVKAFEDWLYYQLPALLKKEIEDYQIREQWEEIINNQNEEIRNYGKKFGVNMGTTVTVILITDTRFFILNIGDTRVYKIDRSITQLTEDHTVVAREIQLGKLTDEQATIDPRRNVLLQCVGASNVIVPDMYYGTTMPNTVYMLCSDGFRHQITLEELYQNLNPDALKDTDTMNQITEYLIQLNMHRQETDNISVITVRTY
jgi:serine/threonine protein phosphatase PrpC